MSYCEDEALFFESAIPADRIEPELALAVLQSAPVATQRLTYRWCATILWDDCVEVVHGHDEYVWPPARAPPALGSSPPHPQAVTGESPWRPFASFRA